MGFRRICEKIILIIVTISLIMIFTTTPYSYAKLELGDDEFYYTGTTKGTYVVSSDNIFSWILDNLSQIADWIIGILTLGPRMVFVGWTALLEKILTWTLETTTGVNINGTGVNSSTDLSSISDSSTNVTVQAIVYNQVAAFNINFFELEYDPTVSGTGHVYVCDKCGKECSAEECCGTDAGCACDCQGNCSDCKSYLAALAIKEDMEDNPPVTMQLKNLVSMWYYILRLLSIAAMLVVLIGIGIKMAISTIASEKALYKRMLIDWVVGVIILFSIHYIMWFIVTMNETIVEIIRNSANSVVQSQLAQANGEESNSDEEIEVSVYEEVRTRAYDPKLTVGLSGMIMYMTLVYFAIRYSFVYLKRYLTLVVLTLMGPPVGVAYAVQKALTGKSPTLKKWLTEYTMNVIVQIVHALIYAIFISEALVLSLKSVAGIIVALIFMNFALKADGLFKRIFKMSEGGGLLEGTERAGDVRRNFDTAVGVVTGAKSVGSALAHTPYAGLVKGAAKVVSAATALGAAEIGEVFSSSRPEEQKFEKAVKKEMNKNGEGYEFKRNADGSDAETEDEYEARRKKAEDNVLKEHPELKKSEVESFDSDKSYAELMRVGEDGLAGRVGAAINELSQTREGTPEYDKAKQKRDEALKDYAELKNFSLPTTKDIVKGHINRVLDIHTQFENPQKGKITFVGFFKGAIGTGHYDREKRKWVSDNNGFYKQLGFTNLLGFTDDDKKEFKEHVWTPIRNGLGGMISMFVGMGTFVAHPTAGMAMMTGGYLAARSTFKKPASSKKYKGTYTFSRFSIPAISKIQKEANERANREIDELTKNADNEMLNRLKNEHPEIYYSLKNSFRDNNARNYRAEDYMKKLPPGTRLIAKTGLGFHAEAIQKHAAIQARQQQLTFMKDSVNLQIGLQQDTADEKMKKAGEKLDKEFSEELAKALGYIYDPTTGNMYPSAEENKEQNEFNNKIANIYMNDGKNYDPVTGTIEENGVKRSIDINKDDVVDGEITINGGKHKITDKDVKILNKEMDLIIDKMVADSPDHKVNFDEMKNQNEIIKALTERLVYADVLKKGDNVADMIKGGEGKLRNAIKRKTEFANNKAKAADDKASALKDEEKKKIRDVISQINGDGGKQVTADEVLNRINQNGANSNGTSQNGANSNGSNQNGANLDKDNVQSYIDNLARVAITRSSVQDSVSQKKQTIDKTIKNKKSEKMKQVKDLLAMEGDFAELTTSEAIDKLSTSKNDKVEVNGLELSSSQAESVLKILFERKELETLNEVASKKLEVRTGGRSYQKNLRDKSDAAMAYYKARIDLENERAKQGMYEEYDMSNLEKDTDPNSTIDSKIKEALNKVKETKAEKEKAEGKLYEAGPFVDVNAFISSNFGKKR